MQKRFGTLDTWSCRFTIQAQYKAGSLSMAAPGWQRPTPQSRLARPLVRHELYQAWKEVSLIQDSPTWQSQPGRYGGIKHDGLDLGFAEGLRGVKACKSMQATNDVEPSQSPLRATVLLYAAPGPPHPSNPLDFSEINSFKHRPKWLASSSPGRRMASDP